MKEPTPSLLVAAYREEARLLRRDGKEKSAKQLERQADRMEKQMKGHR